MEARMWKPGSGSQDLVARMWKPAFGSQMKKHWFLYEKLDFEEKKK